MRRRVGVVGTSRLVSMFQIVLERVPVGLKRLAFSFSVAYLKMAGATRSKRRALQH